MKRPRIIFPLDEAMVEFLQEAFEDRKILLDICKSSDNPEAGEADNMMQGFLSKLESGEDIELNPELLCNEDKDFVVEELSSAIYCYLDNPASEDPEDPEQSN